MATRVEQEKITDWLERVFNGQHIPRYEVNDATLGMLSKLCEHNEEMDRLTQLYIDHANKKIDEYNAEESRLEKLLARMGLSNESTSMASQSCIDTLTDLALNLNIRDCAKTSYFLAMNDLLTEYENLESEMRGAQNELFELNKWVDQSTKSHNKLSRIEETLAQRTEVNIPIAEKRHRDVETWNLKIGKYKEQIKKFDTEIEALSVNPDIHHETIVALSEKISTMKAEMKPLKQKLESYQSLPPDITLAKVKIEERKRELERMEKQMQSDIDLLCL